MKVLLIQPPVSFQNLYGEWDLSGVDTYSPPLGLLYLASFIRKHSHEPYVIDLFSLKWPLEKILDYVHSVNPDVVGISARTVDFPQARKIAEELKSSGCNAPVVLGGVHLTALPVETMKKVTAFDYGVIGEGEVTFLELIEKIRNRQPSAGVRGLVWRSNGQVVLNPPRPFIQDLDRLPFPAWDLLANFPHGYSYNALETKRLPAASILTSRGCPYRCAFCDRGAFGGTVRHHSAGYTLNMIRHLKNRYGIRDLMILDDNFLLNRRKLFQVCETMIEEKMDLNWYCLSHIKHMSEDRLEKIREAGCWVMEVGIESGCERILRLLRRNSTKAEIKAALRMARKAGLKVKGNFIFGLPTETRESLEETIHFALDIDISLFQQTFLTLWPGCELFQVAEKYGQVIKNEGKPNSHFHISFIPYGLTREDLLRASKKAFRRFYLRPRIIWETLTSLTSLRRIRSALLSLEAFFKTMFRE